MAKPKTKQELQDELTRLRKIVAGLESKLAGASDGRVGSLSACEARYQALFEDVDYAVTHVDRNGRILKMNAAGAKMLKMTPDEVAGQSLYDLIPGGRDRLPERFRQAFETGQVKRYELKVETDAGPHWLTSCYVPVRNVEGSVCCLLIISQDITDLKQAKEQQNLLSLIVKQSAEGVALVDLSGDIQYLNNAAARMHGYETSELVGKNISIFHTEEQMSAVLAAHEQVQMAGEYSGELWHLHRNGHVFPAAMHKSLLRDETGEPIGMVGTARDITELKQAEKQQGVLSSIIKQSPEGIALVDADGDVEYINDAFARMHGYEARELIGKNLSIFHSEGQMPAVHAANEQIRATGRFSGEIWHVHRDGHVFPTIMHNSMLCDDEGQSVGMVGTARDITDRKLAEAELRESHEKYRLLIDNIGCPIILYDLRGVLLLTNDDGARMLGGLPTDLVGRNMLDILGKRGKQYMSRHAHVIKTGRGEEHLDRIESPQGHRWIWSSGHPARKSDGTIYGVQVVVRDVTELKESEESQRAMAEQLEAERKTLHEKNIALKQVLEHMENQKQDWAQKLQVSLERAISPFLDELSREMGTERSGDIEELRGTLGAILGSDSDEFSRRYGSLTAREIEICETIAKGKSSKEIADDMNLSLLTVLKHREKVRKKLGLTGKQVGLSAYLRRHLTL